jgi:hypothetical protein
MNISNILKRLKHTANAGLPEVDSFDVDSFYEYCKKYHITKQLQSDILAAMKSQKPKLQLVDKNYGFVLKIDGTKVCVQCANAGKNSNNNEVTFVGIEGFNWDGNS